MSEIVRQLRTYRPPDEWGEGVRHTICDEAADHIEKLGARVKELEAGLELALQYGWEPARALLEKPTAQPGVK